MFNFADNENEKIRSELEMSDEQSTSQKSSKCSASSKLRSVTKWKPPMLGPLPDTFLRLPHNFVDNSDNLDGQCESSKCSDSMLEDEKIAMFLQNEEFMAELRWNEDFLSTLENGKYYKMLYY